VSVQYLSLVRAVGSILELPDITVSVKSMAHAPHDERLQIVAEREKECERIANVLRAMKERIERKDELLQGYERDLAKLRLAELARRAFVLNSHSIRNTIMTASTCYLTGSLFSPVSQKITVGGTLNCFRGQMTFSPPQQCQNKWKEDESVYRTVLQWAKVHFLL